MLNETWNGAELSDVADNGSGYMYSLICDYEQYVKDFGYIDVIEFLQHWTCITFSSFEKLNIGDTVYNCHGKEYIVMDEPYESDDEIWLYIEVAEIKPDGTYDESGCTNDTFATGDLYNAPIQHKDYSWKKIKRESEEPLCPILITKTSQHQN